MRLALDTNILVYAEGLNDPASRVAARNLLERIRWLDVVISTQVLCELYGVLVRKGRFSGRDAKRAVGSWTEIFPPVATSLDVFGSALELAAERGFQIFDAKIIASASDARCDLLLSEDMQHGFSWGGVTLVNPFAATMHPLLEAALGNHH
jgi:predicted nucleic acid-binding protein